MVAAQRPCDDWFKGVGDTLTAHIDILSIVLACQDNSLFPYVIVLVETRDM